MCWAGSEGRREANLGAAGSWGSARWAAASRLRAEAQLLVVLLLQLRKHLRKRGGGGQVMLAACQQLLCHSCQVHV